MRFKVLGSVRLHVNGVDEHVRSRHSRVLIAYFLWRAGRPVSVDDLAMTLWPDAPPPQPRRAVQLAVVRLRALLAKAGAYDTLVTTPMGYRLDAAASDSDLGILRAYREQSRRSWSTEAAELAVLDQVLATVEGRPLADIDSDALASVRCAIEEELLQTVERATELRLASERAGDALAGLMSWSDHHPEREGLWALRVRALAQLGRRGEALDLYEMVRRRLAVDLGVSPGPQLRAAHTLALDERRPITTRGPHRVVPRQLPSAPRGFVGRHIELRRLDGLVPEIGATSPSVVAVRGPAGSGKTALVRQWARRSADMFPDGQIWIDVGASTRAPLMVASCLDRVVASLSPTSADPPRDVLSEQMLRTLTDGRRVLVVLDDAGHADSWSSLVPGTGGLDGRRHHEGRWPRPRLRRCRSSGRPCALEHRGSASADGPSPRQRLGRGSAGGSCPISTGGGRAAQRDCVGRCRSGLGSS